MSDPFQTSMKKFKNFKIKAESPHLSTTNISMMLFSDKNDYLFKSKEFGNSFQIVGGQSFKSHFVSVKTPSKKNILFLDHILHEAVVRFNGFPTHLMNGKINDWNAETNRLMVFKKNTDRQLVLQEIKNIYSNNSLKISIRILFDNKVDALNFASYIKTL